MVSTHLKNISQFGSFPQIGMNIKYIWNHHSVMDTPLFCSKPIGLEAPNHSNAKPIELIKSETCWRCFKTLWLIHFQDFEVWINMKIYKHVRIWHVCIDIYQQMCTCNIWTCYIYKHIYNIYTYIYIHTYIYIYQQKDKFWSLRPWQRLQPQNK